MWPGRSLSLLSLVTNGAGWDAPASACSPLGYLAHLVRALFLVRSMLRTRYDDIYLRDLAQTWPVEARPPLAHTKVSSK